MFVKAKIDAHQKYEERAPTPSCVKWMCDPKMIWDWRKEDKLETWTYFAQPGARGGVSPPQVGMSAFTIAMGRLINIVDLWPYGQHFCIAKRYYICYMLLALTDHRKGGQAMQIFL